MENTLTIVGVFLGIALPIYLIGWILTSKSRKQDAYGRRRSLAMGPLTLPLAHMIPIGTGPMKNLRRTMLQAGHYHRRAAEEFLALRNTAVLSVLILAAIWVASIVDKSMDAAPHVMVACMLLVVAYTLPTLLIHTIARSRTQKIQYALPDAVDMINMLVSGGATIQKAIQRTGKEMRSIHPELADELGVLEYQSDAGSIQQAFEHFGERINQPEVITLATIIRHADRLGGNVTSAFQDYADSIRRNRRQRAEERGNKASVKLLFPVVVFLAPAIYLLLLGPAALELRNFLVKQNEPGGVLSQDLSEATSANDLAELDELGE